MRGRSKATRGREAEREMSFWRASIVYFPFIYTGVKFAKPHKQYSPEEKDLMPWVNIRRPLTETCTLWRCSQHTTSEKTSSREVWNGQGHGEGGHMGITGKIQQSTPTDAHKVASTLMSLADWHPPHWLHPGMQTHANKTHKTLMYKTKERKWFYY